MYVNINGKLTKITKEEYDQMVEAGEAAKSPISKMDELINATLSVADAISGGGKEDADTTYTITASDNTITLTGSDGSEQSVTVPSSIISQSWDAENKEYNLHVSNGETETTVQIQYHLIKNVEANQIVLMAGDTPVDVIQLAQDQDTKYTIEKVGNEIRLIPSDGSAAIPIELDPDLNTTYELTFNSEDDTLTLTPNDNSLPQVISLAKFADASAVEEALSECVDKDDYAEDMSKKADKTDLNDYATTEAMNTALAGKVDNTTLDNYAKKSDIPDVSDFITAEALEPYAKSEDIPDVSSFITAEALEPYAKSEDIPDVSGFATKTELTEAVEPLAKKTDIPDVSGFAEKNYVDTELAKKADATALEPLATKTELNDGLATKADKSEISDMVTTAALTVALETKADKSDIPDVSGFAVKTEVDTALAEKADKSEIPDVSAFITADALAPYAEKTELEPLATKAELEPLATTEAMNTELAKKADRANLINNSGAIYNKITTNGDEALIFNESDGGGLLFTNNGQNIKSFVGVNNEGPTGVAAQIYSKFIANSGDQVANKGCRLNINPNGFYYTNGKTNGSFDANDELVTKKDMPNMDSYATTEDVDAVSSWATEELSSQNAALKAQIEMLNKLIRDIKYPEIENMDIDMDISASGKDIAISGSVTDTVRNITNASSVIAEDIVLENAGMSISATEDVEISGMSTSGTLAKATSNAAMSINNSGNVVIKDSTVAQNSYNAIEIGLNGDSIVKNVLIDNIHFSGNLANNAISIFAHAENAEIVISNCKFDECSNPIRISNRTNVPAKIRFINCEASKWDSNSDYAGFILLQDYTSASAEEAETANRFANLEITFENCYGPGGVKIEGDAEALSNPEHQVIYIWRDRGGKLAYDASKFPKVNAF